MAPLGIAQLATADLSGGSASPPVVLAILYSGTLAAGFANVIVFHGVKLLGPTRVTALQFLVPALAVAMAAIFLGEPIRPIQLVGGAIILAGVALLRRGSWPGGRRSAGSRRAGSVIGASPVIGPDGAAPPVPPLLPGEPPLAILVDYDGTIALTDVSDTVMAEHVPGRLGGRGRRLRRGSGGLAPADGVRDGAGRRAAGGPARDGRRPAARPRLRPVRPARAGGEHPGRDRLGRVRLLHRAGARGARGGGAAGHHGPDHVRGPARVDRLPERPPDLPRLRDLQAQPRPRPPGRRPGGRVHRRRRERPLRRRLQRRRLGQAVARPDLHRGGLAVPRAGRSSPRSTRGWRTSWPRGAPTRPRCPARPPIRSSAARRSGARA